MQRPVTAFLATLLLAATMALSSTLSASTLPRPPRSAWQPAGVTQAVPLGHKHKKKSKKKAATATAVYPLACVAKSDAARGDWNAAEREYGTAESKEVSDLTVATAFASLGIDAGLVALDQADGTSSTANLATYHLAVVTYAVYFRGCS
ncbi:MAG: hypothetical protein WA751_03570 [Candidatus Dormiibacterota bacterium]